MAWTWFTAKCEDCDPPLAIPFRSRADRDEWVKAHRSITEANGDRHTVILGGHD